MVEDDYYQFPKGTHHETTQEPFREIRIRHRIVRRRNAHVRQAEAIDIFPDVGGAPIESAHKGVVEEVWPRREAGMSAMWDMFIAYIMTVLFASLRIALFFIFWGLLLMVVPTILRVL